MMRRGKKQPRKIMACVLSAAMALTNLFSTGTVAFAQEADEEIVNAEVEESTEVTAEEVATAEAEENTEAVEAAAEESQETVTVEIPADEMPVLEEEAATQPNLTLHENGFTVWFNDGILEPVAGGWYGDYPIYLGESMKADNNTITVDGVSHAAIVGNANPKPTDGNIPTSGAYIKVVAPNDGTITVWGIKNSDKTFYAVKGTTIAVKEPTFANSLNAHIVEVKKNDEWYFYASGSKAKFVGIEFALPKESKDIPLTWEGDFGNSVVTFTNLTTKASTTVSATDNKVTLMEGYKYAVSIDSGNLSLDVSNTVDGVLDLKASIPTSITLTATAAAKHEVSGSIIGLPEGAAVTELVFTDENNTANTATVNANGTYTVSLKNGEYTTSATVTGADGYTVYDHVSVVGLLAEDISNDVYFYAPAKAYSTEYKSELTVGAAGEYKTITEAIAAAKAMTRTAGQYVTLKLLDEEYFEQVIVNTNDIKMVAAAGVTPTISYYYGIGYKYYSVDAAGYYNLKNANDKYDMHYAQRWGATVRITGTGFIAEGIDFVNTFNIKVVPEEIGDSAVGNATEYGQGISGSIEERTSTSLDVANTKNVERAAAVAIDAANAEFYQCSFISSQDTLYTGIAACYFRDCYIEGQTDYIFGNTGTKAIFDNCELVWKGYTGTSSKAGYITATRDAYLFRGCNISNNKEQGYTVTPGYYGRPWGNTAAAAFIGTTIEEGSICNAGWESMSGVTPDQATFREYGNCIGNTLTDDSTKFFYTTFAKAENNKFALTYLDAQKLADPANDKDYLGTWEPTHHVTAKLDLSAVEKWGEPGEEVKEPETPSLTETKTYVLEAKVVGAFTAGTKADDTEEKAGTENYFTVLYNAKSKIDASSKKWEDGYSSDLRFNLGGAATTSKNAIKFTTSSKNAVVEVWWVEAGDDSRQMIILDSTGKKVAVTEEKLAKNAVGFNKFTLAEAGTYYLGGDINNNYIFKVEVTETPDGVVKPARADWSTVVAPSITSVTQNGANIDVAVSANVGYDGADKVTVSMLDSTGKVIKTGSSSKEDSTHTISFTPSASGTYSFTVSITREAEEAGGETLTRDGSSTLSCDFILPLTAPAVNSATNKGEGTVEVLWDKTPESEYYIITVDGAEYAQTTGNVGEIIISGLTIGTRYTIGIKAARNDSDKTEIGTTAEITVKAESERTWGFTVYGSSTDTKNNGYVGNINDGEVTVYSESGKGKLVPNSTDGLAFYYTVMDPETENFTLEADVTVDSWTFSNGQEGFGLMVSDTIGVNGSSATYWNNSIMAMASKVEYYCSGGVVTTDTNAPKITMKLGIGALARLGVTAADIESFLATGAFTDGKTIPAKFTTETTSLETICGVNGTGTYNVIGNFTKDPGGTIAEPITTLHLSIQRNNTGYIVTYSDAEGNVLGQKLYYDIERQELTRIDADRIYVGFFASRNARITVNNMKLTVIDPKDDEPAKEREIEQVVPKYTIESAGISNTADYDMVYYGNADGKLTIRNTATNEVIANAVEIKANKKYHFAATVTKGSNSYEITVVPNKDYVPGKYKVLSDYSEKTFTHTVVYKTIDSRLLYVAPNGSASADGTKEHPVDVYTAVAVAQPGQTIVLAGGTYNLSSTLKIERGIDGTEDMPILMVADPESADRPVFDFGKKCAGMIMAGDYWYFYGFDVTNSANGQKGIQVSGNNNTLDGIRTYKNGNTGIQIARYLVTDLNEDWPANNLILNCTSFLNADAGYEDADGFAAKLTIGEGNVFDGCIAAYNADDGWDLFAKAETGTIGKVVIINSVAFKNGYVLDENGKEINAGNGNGFKMGGESLSGHHTIMNSVAFANKAKGFDSNSCPDIEVYNCTSFDNESYNIAFYTNNAVNTAFKADGIISYKKSNSVEEQLKLKGTQENADVYGVNNYYTYGAGDSHNSENDKVSDSWFESLDTTGILANTITAILNGNFGIYGVSYGFSVDRNIKGQINLHDYLALTPLAAYGAGAYVEGASDSSATIDLSKTGMSVSIIDDGKLGFNYYFVIESGDTQEYTLEIEMAGEKEIIAVSKMTPSDESGLARYYCYTKNIEVTQVSEDVDVTLKANGSPVYSSKYSVAAYAKIILANDEYSDIHAMVKALLNYGAAAQDYFEYNTTNPANAQLSEADKVASLNYEMIDRFLTDGLVSDNGFTGLEFYGARLVIGSTVTIRLYYTLATGKSVSDFSFMLNGEALEAKAAGGNLCYVEINDVAYEDVESMFVIEVASSGKTAEMYYGLGSYIASAVSSGVNGKLEALISAMYSLGMEISDIYAK